MELKEIIYKIRAMYIIIKGECMRRLAYRQGVIIGFISQLVSVIMYSFLWNAVYKNAGDNLIYGFDRNDMILYVFASFLVSNLVCGNVAKEMGEDVRDGSVSMILIKPISYRSNLIAKSLGDFNFKLLTSGLVILVWLEVYKFVVNGMNFSSVFFVISLLCSFLIYSLFDFIFGLLAVKTTYSFGMLLIRDAVFAFVSGKLIPFEFMPEKLSTILKMLPFASIVYEPSMIYLNRYQFVEIVNVILLQVIWIIALYLLGKILWHFSLRKISILGG